VCCPICQILSRLVRGLLGAIRLPKIDFDCHISHDIALLLRWCLLHEGTSWPLYRISYQGSLSKNHNTFSPSPPPPAYSYVSLSSPPIPLIYPYRSPSLLSFPFPPLIPPRGLWSDVSSPSGVWASKSHLVHLATNLTSVAGGSNFIVFFSEYQLTRFCAV